MLSMSGSKSVRKSKKVLLINYTEDFHHRALDDLVFQRRDATWPFPTIRFLQIYSLGWLRPIRSPMHAPVEIDQSLPQVSLLLILLPGLTIYSCCRFLFEIHVAGHQSFDRQMVQQCAKADLLIGFRFLPYTLQSRYRGFLALRRSRVGLERVLLGLAPSLRQLLGLRFVRCFLRYYAPVRLLRPVHVRFSACAFPNRSERFFLRHDGGLPVPAQKVSQRAWGL